MRKYNDKYNKDNPKDYNIEKYGDILTKPESLIFCIEKDNLRHHFYVIYIKIKGRRSKLIKRGRNFMDTPITTHYTSEHPELILESWELARRELKKFLNWVLSNSGELGLDRDRKLSRHFINSVFDALKDGGYKDVLGSAIVA